MIAMVEGAQRQKTPNEIALTILLVKLTLVFLFATRDAAAVLDLQRRGRQGRQPGHDHGAGGAAGVPDPDHHRRAAVGDRPRRHRPHDARQRDRHLGPRGRGRRRRRRAAARQDRHHHARQPPGVDVPARARRHRAASWPTPRSSRRSPTRRRKAAASWCWPSRSSTCASATSTALGATFVPFSAQTRMSGVDLDGRADPQGRGRRDPRLGRSAGRPVSRRSADMRRQRRAPRQHAAGRGRRRARARRDRAEGHRQGRHQGALRRAAPHGHPHRDDHRRQPADRRRDRRRGRRRRLPRRSHARGQAQADPRYPGARAGWSR